MRMIRVTCKPATIKTPIDPVYAIDVSGHFAQLDYDGRRVDVFVQGYAQYSPCLILVPTTGRIIGSYAEELERRLDAKAEAGEPITNISVELQVLCAQAELIRLSKAVPYERLVELMAMGRVLNPDVANAY